MAAGKRTSTIACPPDTRSGRLPSTLICTGGTSLPPPQPASTTAAAVDASANHVVFIEVSPVMIQAIRGAMLESAIDRKKPIFWMERSNMQITDLNLSTRQIKAFLALAEQTNFTRAAQQCNLSQS